MATWLNKTDSGIKNKHYGTAKSMILHTWIFYWIGVYTMSIMLMNFVIAMMGNVYDEITEKQLYIVF